MEQTDIVVLVVDATAGATDQDAAIAGEADRLGRGVIIVANKWDLMKGQGPEFVKQFDETLRRQLKFLDYATILHLSAATGERTSKLLEHDRQGGGVAADAGENARTEHAGRAHLARTPARRVRGGATSASSTRPRRGWRLPRSSSSPTWPPPFTFPTNGSSRTSCGSRSASRGRPYGCRSARAGAGPRPASEAAPRLPRRKLTAPPR